MNDNLAAILPLLQSADENDRRQGIIDLIQSGDQLTIPILNKLANEDPSVEIRYYARRALDSLRSQVEKSPESGVEQVADLPTLFSSDDPKLRFEGLKGALKAGTRDAHILVREGLKRETVPQLQASFVIALGRFGDHGDIDLLAEHLQHADSRVRANAVEALATIGTEECYKYLIPVMQDEDNRVKANVIKALQAYGGAPLFELLKKMAIEGEVWMRDSALFALSRFKTPHALAVIGRIAQSDPLERIREKAREIVKGLAEAGNEAAREVLSQIDSQPRDAPPALQAQPPRVPPPPAQSMPSQEEPYPAFGPAPPVPVPSPIETSGPPPALSPREETPGSIPALLRSAEVSDRHWALIRLNQKASVEDGSMLVEVLSQEQEPFLIGMILAILKNIKTESAFGAILPFLGSTDDRIRANAAEALAAINPQEASQHLMPLLEDPNNRVRANTIMALTNDGILDPVESVTRLAEDARDSYRRSALYIVSNLRKSSFVPLLGKLLADPDGMVRSLAFDVLSEYDKAGIAEAKPLKAKIESRIRLEKGRDRFFENTFDQLFSGILQNIRSDQPLARGPGIPTQQKERAAFIQLARKAESRNLLSPEVKKALAVVDAEIERLDQIARSSVKESGQKVDSGNLAEGTREMSSAELLRLQQRKAISRREDILSEAGGGILKFQGRLPPDQRILLQPELDNAEKNRFFQLPGQDFSILPSEDAEVPEIFDLTLRLYQKHVVFFTLFTAGSVLAAVAGLFVTAFCCGILMGINKIIGGFAVLVFGIGYGVFVLGAYSMWKIIIALKIKQYVIGEDPAFWTIFDRAKPLVWQLLSLQAQKCLFLFGWALIALIPAGFLAGIGTDIQDIHLSSLFKLAGMLAFIGVFGRMYFSYLLVEPTFIIEGNIPGRDPFFRSVQYFSKDPYRIVLMYIFASIMMSLIGGTTTQILLFLSIVPSGEFLLTVIAAMSEIFLTPVVFSNLVIFLLVIRQKKGQTAF